MYYTTIFHSFLYTSIIYTQFTISSIFNKEYVIVENEHHHHESLLRESLECDSFLRLQVVYKLRIWHRYWFVVLCDI